MRRPRRPAQDLRFAIECLPQRTRTAMLDGIEANSIIVGAYTDRDGGVCPMLAAHRSGGRTDLASFARAWDRYTRVKSRPRKASDRELLALTSMLKASLVNDEHARSELAAAVAEFEAATRRRAEEGHELATEPAEPPARRETGDRDRSEELQGSPGWSWLRAFRRYDDYEAALDRVREAEREAQKRDLEHV